MAITPKLTDHCSGKLLHAALTNQGDPLGYMAFGGPYEGRDTPEDEEPEEVFESDQVAFLDELATDALSGGQPGVVDRVVRTTCHDRMDPVTAALMVHMGMVPAVALVLLRGLLEQDTILEIIDGEADDSNGKRLLVEGNSSYWVVRIDDDRDIAWNSLGQLQVPAIPETLATAANGRMLREIVSHPALDHIDLLIDRIDAGDGMSQVTVRGVRAGMPGGVGFVEGEMDTLRVSDLERLRKASLKIAA